MIFINILFNCTTKTKTTIFALRTDARAGKKFQKKYIIQMHVHFMFYLQNIIAVIIIAENATTTTIFTPKHDRIQNK